MKIYLKDKSNINLDLNNILKYKVKERTFNYIYSDKGIFYSDSEYLYKMIIEDGNIENIKLNENNLICDYSIFLKGDQIFQIPYDYIEVSLKRIYYQLAPKALVKLVLEYNNNNFYDFYFISDEKISNWILKDIDRFIFLLKK